MSYDIKITGGTVYDGSGAPGRKADIAISAGRIAAVGTLPQIRDMLDQHPLSIRLASDQNRQLAVALMDLDEVVGIDRDGDYLIVRVRHSRRFLQKLNDMVIEEDLQIRHIEPLDESANDVLGYLLGARG